MYVIAATYTAMPDRFYPEMDNRIEKIIAGMKGVESKHAEEVLEQARTVLKDKFRNVATMMKSGDPSEQILKRRGKQGGHHRDRKQGHARRAWHARECGRNILGNADCSVLICKAKQPAGKY